jgi:hypothetical protein
MKKRIMVLCLLTTIPFAPVVRAQKEQQSEAERKQACQKFVQEFYDWYLSKTLDKLGTPTPELVIKYKSEALAPGLLRALKTDFDAQAKVAGEIVGIDFDPFLNVQDPCSKYLSGEVVQRGKRYWVRVYGICEGKKHGKPDLQAELKFSSGHWEFVNFHYRDDERSKDYDLLNILRNLAADRQKNPK